MVTVVTTALQLHRLHQLHCLILQSMDLGNKLRRIRFLNILVFSDLAKTRKCVTFRSEVSTLYLEQHLLGLVCDSVSTIEDVHPAFRMVIILH